MAIAEIPIRLDSTESDPNALFEIVDGVRVELPPLSTYVNILAVLIHNAITAHTAPRNLGLSVIEMLFHLPLQAERRRRPDVAFVSSERWPAGRPFPYRDNGWALAPDLA